LILNAIVLKQTRSLYEDLNLDREVVK